MRVRERSLAARPWLVAAVALVAVLEAGCGADSDAVTSMRGVPARPAVVRAVAAPADGSPVLARQIAMLDARRGLLLGEDPRAVLTPSPVIERTVDGGRRWTTVVHRRGPGAELDWIGRDGGDAVAMGSGSVLRSHDHGRTWTRRRVRIHGARFLPYAFAFNGHGVGLSFPSRAQQNGTMRLFRSPDGGRTWRPVRMPGGLPSGQVAWASARTAYVTGGTGHGRCGTAVWRSDDAGRTWRLLRGSCDLALWSLSFRDPRHGVAGGGYYDSASVRGFSVVRATDDGGEHWHTLWRQRSTRLQRPAYEVTDLRFADARHGWALRTFQKQTSLFSSRPLVTADGGRHWRETGPRAEALSVTGPRSAFTIVSAGHDDDFSGPVARSLDGGRSWATLVHAQQLPLTVSGDRRRLFLTSPAGVQAGHATTSGWRRVGPQPPVPWTTAGYGFGAAPDTVLRTHCRVVVERPGAPVRRVRTPGCAGAVAISGPTSLVAFAHGVLASDDLGAHWSRRGPAPLEFSPDALAADGPVVVAVHETSRRGPVAFVSRDGARTWSLSRTFSEHCDKPSVSGRDVWIACERRIAYSPDAGHRWLVHDLPRRWGLRNFGSAIVALGGGRAVIGDGNAWLLQTRDGGARWTQRWPRLRLPPSQRVLG